MIPWCQAFLHRHFPPHSPPSHPTSLSLFSQQQPSPWDCSRIPKLQLPAAVPSREHVSLSGVCMATMRTVLFSFNLGCHRSAVSLSLKCFSSDPDNYPDVGIGHILQFSHPLGEVPVLLIFLLSPLFLHATEFCDSMYSFLLVR